MIASSSRYMIRSQNANQIYWEQGVYPEWAGISAFRSIPHQKQGAGVEPHYHDNDEIWLFLSGRGEVWLDEQSFGITPGTVVYTPMGTVHRFQMFTEFDNAAIVTPLERQQRPVHLRVEEAGPPVPTVPGFVVPGAQNQGPFSAPGPRCPLSELRSVALAKGQAVEQSSLAIDEYWLVLSGAVRLRVDDLEVDLGQEDLALLRAGAVRQLGALDSAVLALARGRRCLEATYDRGT